MSLSFIFIINYLLKKKSTDPFSGFFLCKKDLILKYEKKFFLQGYKILFDIIYNGKKNILINDIPIVFAKRYSGKSKFNLKIIRIFIRQFYYTLKFNKNGV